MDIVVPHSSKKLRQLWHEYVQQVIDYESTEPLSLYCADLVNTMMGKKLSIRNHNTDLRSALSVFCDLRSAMSVCYRSYIGYIEALPIGKIRSCPNLDR